MKKLSRILCKLLGCSCAINFTLEISNAMDIQHEIDKWKCDTTVAGTSMLTLLLSSKPQSKGEERLNREDMMKRRWKKFKLMRIDKKLKDPLKISNILKENIIPEDKLILWVKILDATDELYNNKRNDECIFKELNSELSVKLQEFKSKIGNDQAYKTFEYLKSRSDEIAPEDKKELHVMIYRIFKAMRAKDEESVTEWREKLKAKRNGLKVKYWYKKYGNKEILFLRDYRCLIDQKNEKELDNILLDIFKLIENNEEEEVKKLTKEWYEKIEKVARNHSTIVLLEKFRGIISENDNEVLNQYINKIIEAKCNNNIIELENLNKDLYSKCCELENKYQKLLKFSNKTHH